MKFDEKVKTSRVLQEYTHPQRFNISLKYRRLKRPTISFHIKNRLLRSQVVPTKSRQTVQIPAHVIYKSMCGAFQIYFQSLVFIRLLLSHLVGRGKDSCDCNDGDNRHNYGETCFKKVPVDLVDICKAHKINEFD